MLVSLGVLLGTPVVVPGQSRDRVPRVGMLEPGRAPGGGCLAGVQQGLRDLGYVEGQTIAVDYRFADGDPARLSALAAQLLRNAPDVLWTHSPQGAKATSQATTTVPVVIGVAGFLVEQGLAATPARPRGNVTGFELGDIEVSAKRLQLLKEAVPTVARVAVLVDPTMRAYDGVPANLEAAARNLGLRLQRVEAGSPEAFEGAFTAMVKGRADALMVADLPLFARNVQRLFALALRYRLPTIAGWRVYAEAGSLLAYGAHVPSVCRRSAGYIDKILKGAKTGDLPVEHPTKFELVVNGKIAQALGISLPASILVGADEVIQ